MEKYNKINKVIKLISIVILIIIVITLTGCHLIDKDYENKKYYLVNSLGSSQIVLPSDEEIENTYYLYIKDNVIYFGKQEDISDFYKIEIIDDQFIFFESETLKGQIKEDCIEIKYINTLYFYTEEYIKNNNWR